MTQHPQRRRHGAELEAAILDAAWEELVAVGFAKLTMESVAGRAKTGIAVLYRRWARKDDIVVAAIRHYDQTHPIATPDTGTLRGDLVSLLSTINDNSVRITAIIGSVFSGLLAGSGITPAQIRTRVVEDRPRQLAEILERAHRSGEIDLDRIPPGVISLPSDLLRHDVLLNLEPVPPERITSIVDDIFMPLVERYRGDPHARHSG